MNLFFLNKRMTSAMTNADMCIQNQDEHFNSKQYKTEILWLSVFRLIVYHAVALYGIYLCFTSTSWKTILFAFLLGRFVLSIGVLAVHRFWCHHAFKAKLPLRIFFCIVNFVLGQNPVFTWSLNHRVHHKHVDTDADPYSIKRGFFFAHMGCHMCKKHPAFIAARAKVSMADLLADPVVRFNKKYYFPMFLVFCLFLPTIVPVYFWGEKWLDAFCVAGFLRYILQLHCTFTINSVGHTFGYRPYDKNTEARESLFSEALQMGEGSHNYHHTFPRDYRTKDQMLSFNSSRLFVEFMALIGQAYDLHLSSDDVVEARKLKTGDGSKQTRSGTKNDHSS